MATYLLLLDADMKLVVKPEFDKSKLTIPVYSIQQGNVTFKYYNTRLVSGSLDITCVGPTHEYYDKCRTSKLLQESTGLEGICWQDPALVAVRVLWKVHI